MTREEAVKKSQVRQKHFGKVTFHKQMDGGGVPCDIICVLSDRHMAVVENYKGEIVLLHLDELTETIK